MKISKISFRVFLILFLTVIMCIPLLFVRYFVYERSHLYNEAVSSVSQGWGESQTVAGPYFVFIFKDKKDNTKRKVIYYLPDNLKINSNMDVSNRKRGIYSVGVYKTSINFIGDCVLSNAPENFILDKDNCFVYFRISDFKNIEKIDNAFANNIQMKESGKYDERDDVFEKGLIFKLDLSNIDKKIDFNFSFDFKGTDTIQIVPIGNTNNVEITSNWGTPSFQGILPTSRNITKDGFNATYNVSSKVYTEDYIKLVKDKYFSTDKTIKVQFYNQTMSYNLIVRALKYGIAIIFLTLITLFAFEINQKKEVHMIQYCIAAVSMVLFYLLLLSLSEHINFFLSFLISSIAVILPNALYTSSIFNNKKPGIQIAVLMAGLYTIIYSIMHLTDYALLIGTILVMLVLYLLMFLTKNINTIE